MAKEKEALARLLEETALYMEILGENDFKVRAYRKGAEALEASKEPLAAIAAGEVKIPGVGEGMKTAVREFLADGDLKARVELAGKVPAGVLELMKVPGLGPKKALAIQKELGINSLSELEYACKENRLITLKGFGKAIQDKVLHALVEMKANAGKLRLDEGLERAAELESRLRKKLGRETAIVAVGALGRRAEIVETLELAVGLPAVKLAGAAKALDWSSAPHESAIKGLGTALSGKLADGTVVTLWSNADERALKILCAPESLRKDVSEKSFDDWESTWLEPEWVKGHRKPPRDAYRVARDGGVKGIFHCHTNFSDGAATLEEMVRGAEERGYQYIGISDHSQSAFYAQGLKPERIREQAKLIKELQKKVSIRIFHGVESDILADGALDYDAKTLDSLDFIVGSIHSRFQMDEAEMTKRLVKALSNPRTTFWGHPTGRLILGRKGYGLDWDKCLNAAAKAGVVVELNANPQRLDVDWRLGPELEKHGVSVCINPDAHAVEGIGDTRFGEWMAEKAMLPKSRILNLMSVGEMEKYLWQRKQHASAR
jgi:DNA polymerase (family 10)